MTDLFNLWLNDVTNRPDVWSRYFKYLAYVAIVLIVFLRSGEAEKKLREQQKQDEN